VIRKFLRQAALSSLKTAGVFGMVKNSEWRRQRLLILCYHGVSLEDEHEWLPSLYVRRQHLERRLEILKNGDYNVLPLGDALQRLYRKELPPRSVAITFDDGTYDFYRQSYPILKRFEFSATVYLTTYYSGKQFPVFNLVCPYMMWKARELGTVDLTDFGIPRPVVLADANARKEASTQLMRWVEDQKLTGATKNQASADLARRLHIDYDELTRKRILQVMNRQEVKQLAAAGIDFQLHTHRHRVPLNEELFRAEIRENRAWISETTGTIGTHFCYPSGVYRSQFLPWLSAEQVVSATTCDTNLATSRGNPLLLPRLVDTSGRSELEFEGWANGVSYFLSMRKPAHSPEWFD
jgi:peptidoglycan/xylan/chitin deacetylase (PgdA/CDA1 family)